MWELHLRSRLLRILENHRIKTGERLTRDGWLELALTKKWVKFHHPILALFNKDGFRRKVDKTINPCIPPHDGFSDLSREEKERYYITFVSYPNEELEITQKGIRFIGTGGYEQRVYELYFGFWAVIAWFITLILAYLFGKSY